MCLPKHGRHVLHLYGDGFLIERRLEKVHDAPDYAFLHHQQFHAERLFHNLLPVLVPVNAVRLEDRRAVRIVHFIRQNKQPRNKSEQMVKNNYDALTYVLEHLEDEINEETILQIARIVTRSAAEVQVTGYRDGAVYVTGREGDVYTPPQADAVPEMMRALVEFIQKSELHPLLKACIAHFYFVYVHPFGDGNGRTARALSYMMLLQAGYDFFRYFSISGIVAEERGKYYRSMRNVEDSDGDMTYFIDVYSGMLARTVEQMEHHLKYHVLAGQKLKELEQNGRPNERQLKGAKWLLESSGSSVTVETWRKKYKVVTETARRDLLALCDAGLLVRELDGRKAVFRVLREL